MASRTSGVPAPQGFRAGYDAAEKWTPYPDWSKAGIARDGWSARPVPMLSQVLVSGDISEARRIHAPQAAEAGLWSIATGDPYLVRLARDRVLIVSSEPLAIPLGWNGGWAASPAGDAFFVVDIEGPSMRAVVAEATGADLDAGSPSAALLFAGVNTILYRMAEDRARIHVEAGFAPYLWRWLEERRG